MWRRPFRRCRRVRAGRRSPSRPRRLRTGCSRGTRRIDAIGVDASRYSLARTDYNSPVDIDLDLLASHSNDNPVYYVQYAHARSCNVDRNAAAANITREDADLSLLDTEADGEVLALLAQWPAALAQAGDMRAPHRVAHSMSTGEL